MRRKLRIGSFVIPILIMMLMTASCSWFDGDDVDAGPAPTATSVQPDDEPSHDDTGAGDRSASDGTACEQATSIPVPIDTESLFIFATCGGADDAPFPVARPAELADLDEALARLTEGLSDTERDAGLFSWFDGPSPVTATAETNADGVVTLRFEQDGEPWQPDASTSSQALSLVDPIAATVFANSGATGIDRSGLCFGELDCEGVLERTAFEQTMFINYGVIGTTACGLVGYRDRPGSCDVASIRENGPLRDGVVTDVAADDVLNMRAAATSDAFIVDTVANGSSVDVTENAALSSDGGRWRLIFNRSGTAGWVNAAFLDLQTGTGPPPPEDLDHQAIADGFITFARSLPSESDRAAATAALADVPFAESVRLGLGSMLATTEDREDLLDGQRWIMDVDLFRAYVGPFSIVKPLQTGAELQVTVGEHDHCASPPMPVPDGLDASTIISIQPAPDSIDSCLLWFAVDLFIDGSGEIEAVTFDTWEP